MSTVRVEEVDDAEENLSQADPKQKRREIDPLVKIVMNKELMEISSTLIAKLEHVRYDTTRRGVFKTTWGADLFASCIKRQTDGQPQFDINRWYAEIVHKSRSRTDYDINPTLYAQSVDTNWLLPLFELEMKMPGFITILHNVLELEDATHTKLAQKAKTETEYDFLNLGARNAAILGITGTTTATSSSARFITNGGGSKK